MTSRWSLLLAVALGAGTASAWAGPADEPPTPPPEGTPDGEAPVCEPPEVDAASIRWLRRPPPAYPEDARELGIEGEVVLRLLLGVDGAPETVEVVSGPSIFSEAAKGAVGQWRAEPVVQSGDPVRARVTVRLKFALR